MRTPLQKTLAVSVIALLAVGAAACGKSKNSSSSSGSGSSGSSGSSPKIALLLPETQTTRYETADKPFFTAAAKKDCNATVVYSNANQQIDTQQNQADQALTNGAKVMVLDPVDSSSAGSIVNKAKAQQVPVISYDRLILNAPIDYFVGFDSVQVGVKQGEGLLAALGGKAKSGKIVWINGAPTDNNAKQFKQGAHSVLDGKVNIGKEYDTPDWSPSKAQQEMDAAITAIGKNNIVGVYAANDGTAGGAVAAMKAAGFSKIPPITGQDAEVAALQRILSGDQTLTVYKAVKPEAEAAAQLACDIAQKKSPSGVTGKQDNGSGQVPSILLSTTTVTKDNVDLPIKDGFRKASDVCTGTFAALCTKAGIS